MNWQIEWQALSARIQGILDAGSFFYKSTAHSAGDARSVKKIILLKNAEIIFQNLKKFYEKYQAGFPQSAGDCLNSFLTQRELTNKDFFAPCSTFESANVQFSLTSLAAFQSEFNFIIADTQFIARRITERAFIHLQRCIVVDEDVRQKWRTAFNDRETKCEELGSLHLLSHGVWAFKADATGGKTDLILSEPFPPESVIESATDTLVLTEWKLVKSSVDLRAKIQEAQTQAGIYCSDVLGGIEVRNYRYLVMVSEGRLTMPEDNIKDGATYRHINIAVNPGSPSQESRKSKS